MEVKNIHKRNLKQSKAQIVELFKTLASTEDKIWPFENWPAIRFQDDLKVGVKGGHGSVRYTIIDYNKDESIKFQFSKPDGFIGTHEFYITEVEKNRSEITHEINMNTASIKATLLWITIVRWLHDALIEDAFDKVENYFLEENKQTKHSLWVRLLREIYRRKSFQTKHA